MNVRRRSLGVWWVSLAVMMLALVMHVSPVAAATSSSEATPAASGDVPAFTIIPGFDHGVIRVYASESLLAGTDDASPVASPEAAASPAVSELLTLSGYIGEFDSPESASAAVDILVVQSREGLGDDSLKEVQIDPIGDKSAAYVWNVDMGGGGINSVLIFVQVDNLVILGTANGTGEMPLAEATAFVSQIASTPASADEAVLHEDGTSTGGLWGTLPAVGDPVLNGLKPLIDGDM